jgi:hypothetical protein
MQPRGSVIDVFHYDADRLRRRRPFRKAYGCSCVNKPLDYAVAFGSEKHNRKDGGWGAGLQKGTAARHQVIGRGSINVGEGYLALEDHRRDENEAAQKLKHLTHLRRRISDTPIV